MKVVVKYTLLIGVSLCCAMGYFLENDTVMYVMVEHENNVLFRKLTEAEIRPYLFKDACTIFAWPPSARKMDILVFKGTEATDAVKYSCSIFAKYLKNHYIEGRICEYPNGNKECIAAALFKIGVDWNYLSAVNTSAQFIKANTNKMLAPIIKGDNRIEDYFYRG